MKWSTENRHLQKNWLADVEPLKVIAPFGIKRKYIEQNTRIISRSGRKNVPIVGKRKVNDQVHAKLIIGECIVLTGSSNFTSNSLENLHEIMFKFSKDRHPEFYKQMTNFFEKLWVRSTPFNGINDI